jgi:cytochrome c oxidase subunit 4
MKTKTYVLTYLGLMGLLTATLALAYVNFGKLSIVLALAIAFAKATLVAANFMHLRLSSRLNTVFALAGLYWLLILFSLSMSDYLTRAWS